MHDRRFAWACLAAILVALTPSAQASTSWDHGKLTIPAPASTAHRPITVEDMAALRRIDGLDVSPDGRRFAIFVRQGDPESNDFRTSWFIGRTQGGPLTNVGHGGEVRLRVSPDGRVGGSVESRESRWSPDGQWIAYTLRQRGELQLWRSRVDGSVQQQITDNPADVREFAWDEDGRTLYFTVGAPRAELLAREKARQRAGYQYDEDLYSFTDFMLPHLPLAAETSASVWVVRVADRHERVGGESDRATYERARARAAGGPSDRIFLRTAAAVGTPVVRADGAAVWLERVAPASYLLRLVASRSPTGSQPISCPAKECSGVIRKAWWSADGERILFWRSEGTLYSSHGFYAWSPWSGVTSTILRTRDDQFEHCNLAAGDHLICVKQTPTRPSHVVAIDMRSGAVKVIADVNPEFDNIRLGKVERFEWSTPKFSWNEPGGKLEGIYPEQAYGYILYPPDFDPAKRYPVFIAPYSAVGFDNLTNLEHPLHVYAANGFVVLNTEFPHSLEVAARLGASYMKTLYSAELGFPHLTMYMESTLQALDSVSARGFIDGQRVGVGGVSHGAFVPLYMVQKYDRIAAISVSGGSWGRLEYYWATQKGRASVAARTKDLGYEDWLVRPEGDGLQFWRQIDIAEHVDAVEAPVLMNIPAHEAYAVLRFIRHLSDAGKAYDAYLFPEETHIKWQPAHLHTIMQRNLDWFRFWLQGYEDRDPAKAEQYARWRKLRKQHHATRPRAEQKSE